MNRPHISNKEIQTLISTQDIYNLEPAYQRNKVWTLKHQKEFIRSIVDYMPLNSITVCKTSNDDEQKIVIDGKQRLTTIFEFYNNDFAIPIYKDNKIIKKSISWKTIQATAKLEKPISDIDKYLKKECIRIKTNFLEREIGYYEYDSLNFDEQKTMYQKINEAINLNAQEKVYGQHCHLKMLLKELWTNYKNKGFKDLFDGFVQSATINDNRNEGIKYLHDLLRLGWGNDLNNDNHIVGGEATMRNSVIKTCKTLDEKLCSYSKDPDTLFASDNSLSSILKDKLKADKSVDTLYKICSPLKTIIYNSLSCDENGNILLSKRKEEKYDRNYIRMYICFLIKYYKENKITLEMVNADDDNKFSRLFAIYIGYTKKDAKLNSHKSIGHAKDIERAIKYLTDEAIKLGIDLQSIKIPRRATKKELDEAKNTVSGNNVVVDPLGKILGPYNVSIDHVEPQAFVGDNTEKILIDKTNNRRKNSSTGEFTKKVNELQNSK